MDIDAIMASVPELKTITLEELQNHSQYDKVSVDVKVLELSASEEVGPDKKVKREALIADQTATSKVVLWEEHINTLEKGKCYTLKNFHVKEFQSMKNLSMPKTDFEITPIENIDNTATPPSVDDEYTTIRRVQIIGVTQLHTYKSCLQCKARVEPQTPPLGKCTKEDCLMIQLFELCVDQISARVMLRYINDEGQYDHITLSAFGDLVYQLAHLPKDREIKKQDLFKAKEIREMRFHTNKKNVILSLKL